MNLRKIKRKSRSAYKVLRKEGVLGFLIIFLQKVHNRNRQNTIKKNPLLLMVKHPDLLSSDPLSPKPGIKPKKNNSYTINWVMSPPGRGSGGHQNLFRFISYLEKAGHKARIYLYSTVDKRDVQEILSSMGDSYDKIDADICWLPETNEMDNADAIFATGWETAYPVYNSPSTAKRFYFVQDYEPSFYPVGTEHTLADNSYRFGFFGITAGGWLTKKLANDYGMKTDFFDFAANKSLYNLTNFGERKEIFFYARPTTPRRGFELGMAALELFHKKHPDYIINLAGSDVSGYDIPFPYVNLKTLELEELSRVYNRCAAALVISLTNMSLLPLELLACGTIPVVNDGENNRLVSDNPYIAYADPSPVALAKKLSEVIERGDLMSYNKEASASIASEGWDVPGKKFVDILVRELSDG